MSITLTESEVLEQLAVRDEYCALYKAMSPTHVLHINPCLKGDSITAAAVVEAGLQRLRQRLPKWLRDSGRAFAVLFREHNSADQFHWHGWLVAPDKAGELVSMHGERWLEGGMAGAARGRLSAHLNFVPNIRLDRVGEKDGKPTTQRNAKSGLGYPIKGWIAQHKVDGVIWA
jgi:hypothetical protein